MPCCSVALNREVQVGASEMHQASRYEAGMHNSIYNPAPVKSTYKFRG